VFLNNQRPCIINLNKKNIPITPLHPVKRGKNSTTVPICFSRFPLKCISIFSGDDNGLDLDAHLVILAIGLGASVLLVGAAAFAATA
jgi:hypothetical protein